MRKIAFLISMVAIVLAFTVTSVSAQKVTSAPKATTEKVSTGQDAPTHAKSCCAKSEAKAGCAKEGEAKGCAKGCAKSCSKAKACTGKGEAKAEEVPVPKKQ